MNTFYCVGNNTAQQLCKSKYCKSTNPFICHTKNTCSCNVHNHNDQFQATSFKKFRDSIQTLQNNQCKTAKIEFQVYINKLKEQFNGFIANLKEQMINQIESQRSKSLEMDQGLYKKVFNQLLPYDQLTGFEIKAIVKQAKKIKRKMSGIENPIKKKIHSLIEQIKVAFQEFNERVVNSKQILLKQISVLIPEKQKFGIQKDVLKYKKIVTPDFKLDLTEKDAKFQTLLTPYFNDLKIFILDKCDLQSQNFGLFTNLQWKNLKILSIQNVNLRDQELKLITQAKFINLVQFKGCANNIGNQGCLYLTQAEWPNLGYINIHSNKITSQGAIRIINKYSAQLWRLDLDYNLIEDNCLKTLQNAKWTKLTQIHLCGNNFSNEVLKKLDIFFKGKVQNKQKVKIMSVY